MELIARTSQQIKEALSVEPSLPAAIDHLLSLELIKSVEVRGEWPDEVITDEGKIAPVEQEILPPFNLALARVSSHPPRKSKSNHRTACRYSQAVFTTIIARYFTCSISLED
jgi:hypothetical protein